MFGRLMFVTSLLAATALPAVSASAADAVPVFSSAGTVAGGVLVDVDRGALAAALADGEGSLITPFAVAPGDTVELELERFRITDANTRFVIGNRGGGDTPLDFDPEQVVLLRGQVRGHTGSHVYLALTDGGGRGRVALGPGAPAYSVRSANGLAAARAGGLIVRPESAGSAGGLDVPYCATASEVPDDPMQLGGPVLPAGVIKQIEMAIETDYEYFSLFGDLDAAGAYVLELYGAVADIYVRDTRTTILVTFVRLWDDEDDLFNEENPLGAFRDYWETFETDVHRDVAQFCSGRRDMPFGGIAWLNALCGGNGYSVIGYVLGSLADVTVPDWANRDIVLAAHELGHNVAAPHTHDIGIDTCNDPSTTPQRGTIMAYCGQTFTGGDANHDLRFHTANQSIMVNAVAEDRCLGDDCNLNGVEDGDDIGSGASDDLNFDGIPDECQDCNGNGLFDAVDIASGMSVDLNLNGVPDECEPDCNGNDKPDDSDIAGGTSEDAYGDGIPDECETDCNGNGISDYTEINLDMSRDLDRNAILDECEDCDGDGTINLVALNGANNVWIADQVQQRLRQYLWKTGTETMQSDDGDLSFPQDVRVTPDGRVLVTSRDDNRVVEYAANGTLVGDFVGSGDGGLLRPAMIAFTAGGDVLVSSDNDRVLRYGADGTSFGAFVAAGSGGLNEPFGMAFGPDGNLYVTSSSNEVLRYDGVTGVFIDEFVSSSDNGGLSDPRGICFVPNGDLLVASRGTNQVLRYDGATGAFIEQFNKNGTDSIMTLDQPWTIRMAPDGGVYVSRAHDHDEHGLTGPVPPGSEHLHLTNARIYHFDVDSGNMVRAYIQGVNSNLEHATGFDFVPGAGFDCNANGVPDNCDIASGTSVDANEDGVPDECGAPCPADLDGTGDVGFSDLLSVIAAWGPCVGCPQDLDDSGDVGFTDLVTVLGTWGDC